MSAFRHSAGANHVPANPAQRLGAWLGYAIDGVTWLVLTFCAIMFLTMTGLVCLQVIFRYLLNSPLTGSEEGARILLIFVSMLGAAVALKTRAHMAIDYFQEHLPPLLRQAAVLLSLACVLAVGLLLIVKGSEFAGRAMFQTTPALRISKGYIVTAFPISGVLMIFYAVAVPLRAWLNSETLIVQVDHAAAAIAEARS